MKTLLAVALFAVLATASPAASAGDETQVPPGIAVISDTPQPSPRFLQFFYFFNRTFAFWWREEGRANTRGRWQILVSEYYDENLEPAGVTALVISSEPRRRALLRLTVGEKNVRTAAVFAAYAAITVIETAAEEK